MPALCNTAQVRMEECGTASGSGDAGSILGCSFVFYWAAGALWDVVSTAGVRRALLWLAWILSTPSHRADR